MSDEPTRDPRKITDVRKVFSLTSNQAAKLHRLAVSDSRSEASIVRMLIENAPEVQSDAQSNR